MALLREPAVYVIGRQTVNSAAVDRFLSDNDTSWETDTEVGGELLSEMGGRLCYMSFGAKQGRRSNAEYIGNILDQRHGSVLEHAVWNLLITGVSRSLTHELIRHRAGFGYCLTGDTLIYSDHFTRNKREGTTKRSLRHLFEMTQTPHGRSRIKLLRLRCLDEQTQTFTTGRVAGIAYSGRKPVFRIELEDGKYIQCSRDHRFLTPSGWMPLHAVVGGLALSLSGLAMHGALDVPIAVNGTVAYQDKEWLRQQYIDKGLEHVAIAELAGVSKHTIHAWIRKHGLQKPLGSWTIGRSPWNKGRKYHAGWRHSEATTAFGAQAPEIRAVGEKSYHKGGHVLTVRFKRITAVTYLGEQDTYNIEMEAPHHNFVANGVVTHNSQLSQRYVDETETDFVEPDIIADDPRLHGMWLEAIEAAHGAYVALAEALTDNLKSAHPELGRTARRKAARQAARSVLPNATETKIFVTANARALRHFIELRGSEHAEPEIRKLAVVLLRLMQEEAPHLFGDFTLEALPDGSLTTRTPNSKV